LGEDDDDRISNCFSRASAVFLRNVGGRTRVVRIPPKQLEAVIVPRFRDLGRIGGRCGRPEFLSGVAHTNVTLNDHWKRLLPQSLFGLGAFHFWGTFVMIG
jgi:hypothetical protein